MPSFAHALSALRSAVERGRPDQQVPVRRWHVSALLTAYDLRVADVERARAVLRTIDETRQQCPVCNGTREMVPDTDLGWLPGAIKHRKDCALAKEKGE
jgi:hypothetical protein